MVSSVEEAKRIIARDGLRLPCHIAVLLDGNGRWALHRGLTRPQGHRAGGEAAKRFTRNCHALGIPAVTLFGFSTENWDRPMDEVQALITILEEYLYDIAPELTENNVRLRMTGRVWQMPARVRQAVQYAVERTASSTGMVLNLAVNYGGRAEIIDALNSILREERGGHLRIDRTEINQAIFKQHLYAPDLPFPDLLIRTSGEQRVSNFLLWEIERAYYHITPTLWPDFDLEELWQAILSFQSFFSGPHVVKPNQQQERQQETESTQPDQE